MIDFMLCGYGKVLACSGGCHCRTATDLEVIAGIIPIFIASFIIGFCIYAAYRKPKKVKE